MNILIMSDSNEGKFKTIQELNLTGFRRYRPYGPIRHRLLNDTPVKQQFESFVTRIANAVGKAFLPVYRMADGEFSLLLGPRPSVLLARIPLKQRFGEYINYLSYRAGLRGFTTCWGESYSEKELDTIRVRMEHGVRYIAERGILGLYFAIRDDHWGEQYFHPVCSWLDNCEIQLSVSNYTPFYFIYALLNGPARRHILPNASVLVVTHLTAKRSQAIEAGLREDGAASVQFLNISANRSMTENLHLSSVRMPVDLVLVAAGIGSVNILTQLEELSAPCIDCGVTLDCYVNPDLRWKRAFLLDDERLLSDDFRLLYQSTYAQDS